MTDDQELGRPLGGTLKFDYIKSAAFRVIHADGAVGSITPTGQGLFVSFYSERLPLPTSTEHEVAEGQLGKEISRSIRSAIVREMEIGVHMSLTTAKALRVWLDEKIANLETVQAAAGAEPTASETK